MHIIKKNEKNMMLHYSDEQFTDIYMDSLYAIERTILEVHRLHTNLIDLEIIMVLEDLIREYQARDEGRIHEARQFCDPMLSLLDALKEICEDLLEDDFYDDEESTEPLEVYELASCLKRVRSSVKFWNKKSHCRQGYIQFITQYVK